MTFHPYTYYFFILIIICFIDWAHAARPLIVDDARIVDSKACQLESWMKKNTGSIEYWTLPACNFTHNLELTFGGAVISNSDNAKNPNILIQGKTLFKPMEINGWGIGLAIGAIHNPTININRNLTGDLYAYIPTSFSFRDGHVVLNTNVGWLYRRSESNEHHLTLGVGSEILFTKNSWLVAEIFGQNQGKPFFHIGFRYWIYPDHIQVDTTYGNRFGSGNDEQWFTVGLRLISPAFLP
ncbi:hypothetical protein SAMN05428952_10303 [Nitrosomonas sp. Nm132]|nr:hypothetical protein SAMN05428952_10303 [Nitrosomonas sp. Nm132]